MTNFDFLKSNTQFNSFPTAASALNCCRAMEFAVKWMYSVDKSLAKPYQDTMVYLVSTEEFREFVGVGL